MCAVYSVCLWILLDCKGIISIFVNNNCKANWLHWEEFDSDFKKPVYEPIVFQLKKMGQIAI